MGKSEECDICESDKHPYASFCKRCKRLIGRVDTREKVDKEARIEALKNAWDGKGFRCYYTGVRLIDNNHKAPLYITFDHLIPRKGDKIVVTAAVVNDMKSDLSDREFRDFVIQLANHFKGGTFNEEVFKLEHWKR